ncbi:PAS domain S-box protein [Salinimicrobium catena]
MILKDVKDKKQAIYKIIENLPLGFVVSNLVDKKVLISNKELGQIYGFQPEYLDEVNSYHIYPQNEEIAKEKGYPDDISPADIVMPQEKKGQIIFNRKGQYQTVDLKRIPLKKEKLLVTLVSNVSELTEKEEELAASERISRFIFDTAGVGLTLVDDKGVIVRVNKTFCEIYGYSEEELVGEHFALLLPEEKRKLFANVYNKKMKKMTTQSSSLQEVQVIKKSGEILDVLSTSRTVFDHHFKGTIYSVLDVTEIRTDHGKLEAAVEGGKLGTWNINMQTGHNEVNHHWAEMLGYKKAEISPNIEFFHTLLHPDDRDEFFRGVERINRGEQDSFTKELRLKCKDGAYKWILDSGVVLKRDAQGKPLLMAGAHVDIDEMKKAQLEIISHSDRLRRAQEMGLVGDWELDMETDTFSCSSMIFRIFGRRKEQDFSYENFLNLFESSSTGKIRKQIHQAIKEQTIFSHDAKIYWEDGTSKYLKMLAVPVLGPQGKVVKMSGILQDVTSVKTTKDTLKETTKRLQVLSDNIPGGLLQFKMKKYFPPQILYLSRGAEKIWGVSRERALEGDSDVLLEHIDSVDKVRLIRSLLVASKRLERINITWRTIEKSGEIRWHQGVGIPSKNEDNSLTWNALVLDITDKKKSESKIKEQEEYMQVLTQHASDAIIACDEKGNIRFVNNTLRNWLDHIDMNLPPKERAKFYHLYSIEHDRLLKPSELSLFQALEGGKVVNHEFIIKHPGKNIRYVQANGSALYGSSGEKVGAMVVLRDITERVQKELEVSNATLKAREKERSKIAAEIHDGITQSLSVVAMNLKNLRFDYKELESSQNYEKAIGYLQGVIEQSRSLAHQIMPTSIQDFGLVEAVQELVAQCSIGSKKKIGFEYTGYGRVRKAKELHIYRVIQEGLGNALKHSGAGDIRIRMHFGKDHIRVTLKDDGKGFDAAKNYVHNGIGLLSMRDRIKKLNGRFRIFSGKNGTVVWFKVPVGKYIEENEKAYTNFYS